MSVQTTAGIWFPFGVINTYPRVRIYVCMSDIWNISRKKKEKEIHNIVRIKDLDTLFFVLPFSSSSSHGECTIPSSIREDQQPLCFSPSPSKAFRRCCCQFAQAQLFGPAPCFTGCWFLAEKAHIYIVQTGHTIIFSPLTPWRDSGKELKEEREREVGKKVKLY